MEEFENEPAEYHQKLVTFVDILGFKNLIKTSSASRCLEVVHMEKFLSSKTWYEDERQSKIYSFSDLIVNAAELDSEDPLPLLFEKLRVLGFFQFKCAVKEVFVRGGVTYGDIYAEDHVIFGPALIKAYELESEIANWPIIVIDPILVTLVKDELDKFKKLGGREKMSQSEFIRSLFVLRLNSLIHEAEESIFFLDYINCTAYEDTATGELDYLLLDHKKCVLSAYKKYKHYKYKFIAKYHDLKCKQYFPDESHLLIGELSTE